MSDITMTVPDETLAALRLTPEQVGSGLRLAAAVKLYELGRLSSGAAAQLAGIPRALFLCERSVPHRGLCRPGAGPAHVPW